MPRSPKRGVFLGNDEPTQPGETSPLQAPSRKNILAAPTTDEGDPSEEPTQMAAMPLKEALRRVRSERRERGVLTPTRGLTVAEKSGTMKPSPPQVTHAAVGSAPRGGKGGLTPGGLVTAMDRAVAGVQVQKLSLERLRASFKVELLPLLRQSLELSGGDGIDSYVSSLVNGRIGRAKNSLLSEISAHVERINQAKDRASLVTEGKRLVGCCRRALEKQALLSLRVLTEELEHRIELDTILALLFSSKPELVRRKTEAAHLLEQLREELGAVSGRHSEVLFRNFSRLKTEKRLIDAEEQRRAGGKKR